MFEILELLDRTKGTKAKEAILRENWGQIALYFKYAKEWNWSFGMTWPAKGYVERTGFAFRRIDDIFDLLEKLRLRELTGNAAKAAFIELLAGYPPKEQKWIIRLLNRKLRLSIGIRLLNKVHGYEFIEYFHPMKGGVYNPDKDGHGVYLVEPKYDGLRCVIICKDGKGTARSFTGHVYPHLKFIADRVAKLYDYDCTVDTEVLAHDWGRTMHYASKSDVPQQEREDNIHLHCFDVLTALEWSNRKSEIAVAYRKKRIKIGDHIHKVPGIIVPYDEIDLHYEDYLRQGFEGVMLKRVAGSYVRKRSKDWLKLKPFISVDCDIIDIIEGEGNYEGVAGSMRVAMDGKTPKVGIIGNMSVRKDLLENKNEYIGMIGEVKIQDGRKDAAEFGYFVRLRKDK